MKIVLDKLGLNNNIYTVFFYGTVFFVFKNKKYSKINRSKRKISNKANF